MWMRGLRFLEDYLTDFDNFWCFEKPRCPSIHFSNFREDPRGIWDNPRANPSIQSISGPKPRSEQPSQPAPIINISHQNHSNSFQDVLECFYHRLQLIFTYQTVRNCWRSGGGQILMEVLLEESFKAAAGLIGLKYGFTLKSPRISKFTSSPWAEYLSKRLTCLRWNAMQCREIKGNPYKN